MKNKKNEALDYVVEMLVRQKTLLDKDQNDLAPFLKEAWCMGYVLSFTIAFVSANGFEVGSESYLKVFQAVICHDAKLPEDEIKVVKWDKNKPTKQIVDFHQGIEDGKKDMSAFLASGRQPMAMHRYLKKRIGKKWLFF